MSDTRNAPAGPDREDDPLSANHSISEANKVLQQWAHQVGQRDIKAVLGLYAPDAILVPTLSDEVRERTDSRRKYFESFLANEGLTCGITVQKGRVSAKRGTVVIGGLYCFTMKKQGHTEIVPARFLFTFEEIDGHWLITGHHSSKAVE